MKWEKQGLIFDPQGKANWYQSHAALPVPEHIEADIFRIYFSGRDELGRAQIGYFVIDINRPDKLLELSAAPVITLGPLGSFDDRGVTSACLVKHQGKSYQYYSGWILGQTVPFYFFIGLAVGTEGQTDFHKAFNAPVLGRGQHDPFLTASPYILIEDGVWRMWYVSCTKWIVENGKPKHFYLIKYAESSDGIHWQREGLVCIDFQSSDEYAISRPCVLKENGMYKMWYSYRGDHYRIGYAESADGIAWERKDNMLGLDVSESGWDSEMVEYPYVFGHKGTRYMLYNGNNYGHTGIGYAILKD